MRSITARNIKRRIQQKRFGNQIYKKAGMFFTHTAAMQKAKQIRAHGGLARVVRLRTKYVRGPRKGSHLVFWNVFYRKRKKIAKQHIR